MNPLRIRPAVRPTRLMTVMTAHRSRDATRTASYSTAFRSTAVARQEREDADPTPDKARAGSEQSMPGANGDDIAASKGAYDSSTTRPDESGKQMEKEDSDINMNQSAASREPADNATSKKANEKTSSQSGSKPGASGGSSVRRGKAN